MLVTGSSGGIGRELVRGFAAEGAQVVLHCFRHRAAANALACELKAESLVVSADLRSESEVEGLFTAALRRFTQLDVVVVNAGVWSPETPIQEITLEQWRSTVEADLTSAFLTCRAFFRHLAAKPRDSAAVVLMGSTAGMFGERGHADYAAAKAGMVYGLTRTLKNEIVKLAPRGRVNCICPGWTATEMAAEQLADACVVADACATIPLNKVATPQDVAAAAVFLASDNLAGHLSGVILPVSGGMEGRLLNRA